MGTRGVYNNDGNALGLYRVSFKTDGVDRIYDPGFCVAAQSFDQALELIRANFDYQMNEMEWEIHTITYMSVTVYVPDSAALLTTEDAETLQQSKHSLR